MPKKEEFKTTFDQQTQMGYTSPQPTDLNLYYKDTYWDSDTLIGLLKRAVFNFYQKRRVRWLKMYCRGKNVLDIGSGEANFSKSIKQDYEVINIEPVGSGVKNPDVSKLDFLTWRTRQKFDCICFWESLEHTPSPEKYLKKAYRLLGHGGIVLIEYPRFDSFESRLFGKFWFHRDLPRHLSHLTGKGLKKLLFKSDFRKIKLSKVLALEYAPWGFMASILTFLGTDLSNSIKRSTNLVAFILIMPVLFLTTIIELILFALGESPIGFVKAEK